MREQARDTVVAETPDAAGILKNTGRSFKFPKSRLSDLAKFAKQYQNNIKEKNMPREPHENMKQNEPPRSEDQRQPRPEDRAAPPPPPHQNPDGTEEKHACNCNCEKCVCKRKHLAAKVVAALIIFFAGFGLAMACKCAHHSGKHCHAQQMCGKHAPMRMSDGAGNTIIINTDGACKMMSAAKMPKAGKKHQPQMMTPNAPQQIPQQIPPQQQLQQPQQMQQMPLQNMATMPIDAEDEE